MNPRRRGLALGGIVYLLLATALFSKVLLLSPTRATTCPCADPSLLSWYFEWMYVAVIHGHNPFFSTAVFHPVGTNLLANTSAPALAFLLLPITAIFGPLASLNVALILAPVCSGLAAMWLAQRWTSSSLAAFLVGALYAFSPIVLLQSAGGHIMLTFLVVPPLLFACIEDLFWRRHHSPIKIGAAIGGLVVFQFFVGTEILLILAIVTAISLLGLGVASFLLNREDFRTSLRSGLPGLGLAVLISVVVLAWPAAYALFGPEHYFGVIWGGTPYPDASLRSFVLPVAGPRLWWDPLTKAFPRPTFVGPVLLAVVSIAPFLFRRDRRLQAAAFLTLVLALLSLGRNNPLSIWHYLGNLPVLVNIFNDRFAALLLLPAGLVLVRVIDHVRERQRGALGDLATVCLAGACVLPFVFASAGAVPYTARKVWEPLWYQQNASSLPPNQVIVMVNKSGGEDFLAVQALHAMHYSIVGGGPPQSFKPSMTPDPAARSIAAAGAGINAHPNPVATPAQARIMRTALRRWRATLIVLTEDHDPSTPVGTSHANFEAAWLASILGQPRHTDDALVWQIQPSTGRALNEIRHLSRSHDGAH